MENNQKYVSVLESFGLDPEEAMVYLTMIRMGNTTVLEISRRTEIKRGTVYHIINRLIGKNLVKTLVLGKKNYYVAENPKKMSAILDERKRELEEIIPFLKEQYRLREDTPNIYFYEGREGVERIYEEILKLENKKEVLWFGCQQDLFEEFYDVYKTLEDRDIEESSAGIRLLMNPTRMDREYAKSVNDDEDTYKIVKARVLPKDLLFVNTNNIIFENKLVIFSVKKDYFVVIIESMDVANTYRALFETAWREAEKR